MKNRQRKPFTSSKTKIMNCLSINNPNTKYLPCEFQMLTGLSRPTVFNVLIYFQERGILSKHGKKYGLDPHFVARKGKKPLGKRWQFTYELLLQQIAEENKKAVNELPGYFKELCESRVRQDKHFASFRGEETMLRQLNRYQKENLFVSHSAPINRTGFSREEKRILKALSKRHSCPP